MGDLQGFEEFVTRLLRVRDAMFRFGTKNNDFLQSSRKEFPSNATIQKLLIQSYYASLELDETRPTRFTLLWQHSAVGRVSVANFPVPIQLESPTTLCRLAHATKGGAALFFIEQNDAPAISEIVGTETAFERFTFQQNRPERGIFGVQIDVAGPGDLVYYELPLAYRYCRGVPLRLWPVFSNPCVQSWMAQVNRLVKSRLAQKERHAAEKYSFSADNVLSTLLQGIVNNGHGGMLIVVPEGLQYGLTIRYPVQSDLILAKLTEHWETNWRAAVRGNDAQSAEEKRQWESSFWKMLAEEAPIAHVLHQIIRITAGLANIDGALVFDRSLTLLGFGAIIDDADISDSNETVVTSYRDKDFDCSAFLRLHGTRHRAAYNLCRAVENSIAFIVSQDGDLRLFARDGETIHFHENLHP